MNFDRAAGYYDETRTDRPETIARVVDFIRAEVAGRGVCLEIGIGTGRIGLPVASAGVPLIGVDLSAAMIARLIEKAGGGNKPMLAMADATALPFRDGGFGAAFGSHVFHLIAGWRDVVGELMRVVRPGGVVLTDLGGWDPLIKQMRHRFTQAVGLAKPFPGTDNPEELDAEFEARGARVRVLPGIEEPNEVLTESLIRRFERAQLSYTWQLDDEALRRGVTELRSWAAQALGPGPHRTVNTVQWRVYDLPA